MLLMTTKGWRNIKPRFCVLAACLAVVTLFQLIPGWGERYARHIYPLIARPLSWLSGLSGVCLSDVFYLGLIALLVCYPVIALFVLKRRKLRVLGGLIEAALWLHVWFYMAWGLNYWQADFYRRTHTDRVEYSPKALEAFVSEYIAELNAAYVPAESIDEAVVRREIVKSYQELYRDVGLNKPFTDSPRVKTMLLTPLASMVGVTGSMGPFFAEFTLNGDVLPVDYPATYAHELSHLFGITTEGEANFYAYMACTHSGDAAVRFSGLLSIFHHLMNNVHALMGDSAYAACIGQVRPEIRQTISRRSAYWQERYNPSVGRMQDRMYELYLRRHHVEGGRKSYSGVIALLISWQHRGE